MLCKNVSRSIIYFCIAKKYRRIKHTLDKQEVLKSSSYYRLVSLLWFSTNARSIFSMQIQVGIPCAAGLRKLLAQPSLVFARVYAKQGIKASHTSFIPSKGFFVLRIQTKDNPFEGTKEVCKECAFSSWYFFNKLLSMRSKE